MLIKTSSKNWLDISDQQATKGNALIKIQKLLNISREETLVFGDYHNDIEMLKEADFSFSMKNAHKDITRIANYTTESNDHFGVERVLSDLVKKQYNLANVYFVSKCCPSEIISVFSPFNSLRVATDV